MSEKVLDVPTRIELPRDQIRAACRKYHVEELAVFGSVLRDDFRQDSDVDFLAKFQRDDAGPWMSYLNGLQEELSRILRRSVDVLDWVAVEKSRNPFRRHAHSDHQKASLCRLRKANCTMASRRH
jgi:predicted nucleotidyltransferase